MQRIHLYAASSHLSIYLSFICFSNELQVNVSVKQYLVHWAKGYFYLLIYFHLRNLTHDNRVKYTVVVTVSSVDRVEGMFIE